MTEKGDRPGKSVRGLAEKRYVVRLFMFFITCILVVAALQMEVILESLGITGLLLAEMGVFVIVVVGIDLDCRWGILEMEKMSKLRLMEETGEMEREEMAIK